jgi:hypothetical protein
MRPVLQGDVTSVARALLLVSVNKRHARCAQILEQADLAEAYVQQYGRLHGSYGNGSLMAAARRYPLADEPTFDDVGYCQCVVTVLLAVMDHSKGAS